MRHSLLSMTTAVDSVLKGPTSASPSHADLSHWARYSTVLAAGYIEEAMRTIVGEFIQSCSRGVICNYMLRQLGDFTNAKPEKIKILLDRFDENWFQQFVAADSDMRMRNAVGSIIANRHLIAHGRNSGVTMSQITTWHRDAKRMIQYFDVAIPS